jgi:transcriptional regulator with XRE-family HTH domain
VAAPDDLKKWREDQDLSQKDAAAKVPVSPAAWCEWEQGKKVPDIEKAEALERVTGIPMSTWAAFAKTKRLAREGTDPEAA